MDYDSLVAPKDRPDPSKVIRQATHPPLSFEETREAARALNKNWKFPAVDRAYYDPPIRDQKYVLVSFIPSKGAKPDEDNFYGMMKVRGCFGDEESANQYAENLIKNHDSYHEIYHAYVGRPFPVVSQTVGYEHDVVNIDIKKKTVKLISEDILNKKREEEKEIREMQEREQTLLDESKRAKEDLPLDPYDTYITDQVKRAQLIWTYKETIKKCEQMKDIIKTTNATIAEAEKKNPEYREQYREKYMKARHDAGLDEAKDEESFIKYLGMDLIEEDEDFV